MKSIINKTYSHTPDFAPTILEALGIKVDELNLGKSIFSKRKLYQHLITPRFIVRNGVRKFGGECQVSPTQDYQIKDEMSFK